MQAEIGVESERRVIPASRRRMRRLVAAASVTLMLVAAGCSSDPDDEDETSNRSSESSTTVADATTTTGDVADPSSTPTTATPGSESTLPAAEPVPDPGTADPVDINEPSTVASGASVRLVSFTSTQAEASLPGEVSGPAVVMVVEFTNGTSEPIDLDGVTVDLQHGDGISAGLVTSADHEALAGVLAPGEAASGSYLFTIPTDDRDEVTVSIKFAADEPRLFFAGSIADA